MTEKDFHDLKSLAHLEGIQTSYLDMAGRTQTALPETLVTLLEKFGHHFEGARPYRNALGLARKNLWQQALPEVLALREESLATIRIRLPDHGAEDKAKALEADYLLEDGEKRQLVLRPVGHQRIRKVDGMVFKESTYLLPRFPRGYHQLSIKDGGQSHTCMVISAPPKLYVPDHRGNRWGLFAPLYSLHGRQSWGAGNFSDWERLLQFTIQHGGGIVSGLPILGAFLGKPLVEPSPYSPASRLFWNEFYLDVTAIPEFTRSSEAQKLVASKNFRSKIEKIRNEDLIDYPEQMALRRKILEILAKEFFAGRSNRRKELDAFLKSRPEAGDYAAFRATCDQMGKSWHTWGAQQKNGKLKPGRDYRISDFQFYLYAQWQAQQQIDRLITLGREGGAELYLDLPLGVHPDSYDAWRERDSFATGVNAGCPPDPCFTKGQDWGFSPLDPKNMRKNRYEYLIRFFRFQMRHTGLLRVDHVMGLHRLYWVPQGRPASEGAYVTYPAEELYSILALESHRFKTMMVGENLGTVPPQVNRSMDKFGMRRMYVVQYEIQPRDPAIKAPPAPVVASLNTHDMPPFAAFQAALDTDDRKKLGLLKSPEVAAEKLTRTKMFKSLSALLKKKKFLKNDSERGALAKAALRYLASSQAETVLLNLEDLWGEKKSQNVPGTSTERPNWRRKMKFTLEEIEASEDLKSFLHEVNNLREEANP